MRTFGRPNRVAIQRIDLEALALVRDKVLEKLKPGFWTDIRIGRDAPESKYRFIARRWPGASTNRSATPGR